jgi:hypothetical protein
MIVRKITKHSVFALAGAVFVAGSSPVWAQYKPDAKTGVTERKQEDFDPRGVRMGSFLMFPKLTVNETYDTNIFKTETGPDEDFITDIEPSLSLRSDWNSHSLRFDAKGNIGRFASSSDDDYEKADFKVRGRIDATKALTLNGEARHKLTTEERGGDDVGTDAAAPVEGTQTTFKGSAKFKPNRVGITISGDTNNYDIDDNLTIAGATTNNDDRDRQEWTGAVRLGYDIQENYEAFGKITYNLRDYEDAVDDGGLNRDSDGYNIQAGLAIDLSNLVRVDIGAGWMEQSYDDATLETISGYSADVTIRWNVTSLTTVRANASRSIDETTTAGVSGLLVSKASFGVDQEFLRNLIASADVNFTNQDYRGDTREDDKITASAGLKYKLNRNIFANAKYTYEDRDSNQAGSDYDKQLFLVTLGGQF